MRSRILAAAVLALLLGPILSAPSAAAPAPPSPGELAAHVAVLAAPDMEGRGSGAPGGERAARYIAEHLAAMRLAPGGEQGDYLQPFVVTAGARIGPDALLARGGPQPLTLLPGRDWTPHGGSLTGEVSGQVVLVGRDGYAGADAQGKIALALDGGDRAASRLDHLIEARRHGVAALLIVGESLPPLEATAASVRLMSGSITRTAADALLAQAGMRPVDVARAARVGATATGVHARLRVSLEREERRAANVIGILPGTDPALAAEAVVLGAHYDHLGRAGGVVHPGADDNASGTAVVLGLARAFASAGGAPRTLVFVLFSGEEIGLLGSAHYTRHPAVPLDRTVAMLNFDMVGRKRTGQLSIGGVESGAGLRALVTWASEDGSRVPTLHDSPYGPSDHSSFYSAGVPVLFFHTGVHDDYHGPGDTADKIDAAGMADVARIGGRIAAQLAGGIRPAYAQLSPPGRAPRMSGAPGSAFLGVSVRSTQDGDGLTLGSVVAGSAAARAGLRDGDVIVRLDDTPLGRFEDLRQLLAQKRPGDAVSLLYLRDGEDRRATATLGALP